MSPSILLPQHTGASQLLSMFNGNGNGAGGAEEEEEEEEREDDGIAREKKGEKEQMPMEKNLYVSSSDARPSSCLPCLPVHSLTVRLSWVFLPSAG